VKRRITEISVLQTSKIVAIIYGAIGIIVCLVMLAIASGMDEGGTREAVVAVFMLIFYPIGGFVGTAMLAAFYNFIAKRLGGIEFSMVSEPFAPPPRFFFEAQASNVDQELRSLAKLKEDGLITEEEFSKKKQTLLGL
jgi:hypothetical protein